MKLIALFTSQTPNLEESNSGSGVVEITTAIKSNPSTEDRNHHFKLRRFSASNQTWLYFCVNLEIMPLASFSARLLTPRPFVVPVYKTKQIMFIKSVPSCGHIFANNLTSYVFVIVISRSL